MRDITRSTVMRDVTRVIVLLLPIYSIIAYLIVFGLAPLGRHSFCSSRIVVIRFGSSRRTTRIVISYSLATVSLKSFYAKQSRTAENAGCSWLRINLFHLW